jgi:hypothetical protein
MLDLYNKKYNRQTLKDHIYDVKLIDIVKTQHLDISFIVKYILSDLYQLHNDDKEINIQTILLYQKHIDVKELENALNLYNSDDDSIEDFESISKKIY